MTDQPYSSVKDLWHKLNDPKKKEKFCLPNLYKLFLYPSKYKWYKDEGIKGIVTYLYSPLYLYILIYKYILIACLKPIKCIQSKPESNFILF